MSRAWLIASVLAVATACGTPPHGSTAPSPGHVADRPAPRPDVSPAIRCTAPRDCIQRGDAARERAPIEAARYYQAACADHDEDGCARAGNLYLSKAVFDRPRALLFLARACQDDKTTPEFCADLYAAEEQDAASYRPDEPLPPPCAGIAPQGALTKAGLRWECGEIHVTVVLRSTDYDKDDQDGWVKVAWADHYGHGAPARFPDAAGLHSWRDVRGQRHAEWHSTAGGGEADRAWELVHVAERRNNRNLEIVIGGYERSDPPEPVAGDLRRAFVDDPLVR